MRAIITKFYGVDYSYPRIFARADGGQVFVPYQPLLSRDQNHLIAARALAVKLRWDPVDRLIHCDLPGQLGQVHIYAGPHP